MLMMGDGGEVASLFPASAPGREEQHPPGPSRGEGKPAVSSAYRALWEMGLRPDRGQLNPVKFHPRDRRHGPRGGTRDPCRRSRIPALLSGHELIKHENDSDPRNIYSNPQSFTKVLTQDP